MIRTIACAAAAVLLTTGAVAAMADTGPQPTVSINQKTGEYCLTGDVVTGTLIPRKECHSVSEWAKQGVTFSRR